LRSRQKVLEVSGENARDLDHWEELMVLHGLRIMEGREFVAATLTSVAVEVMRELFPAPCVMTYEPSAPMNATEYAERLRAQRGRDRVRKSAGTGPHRDDLRIELANLPARSTASQGQHRSIVLALKAAEMRVVGQARGVRPILLLDDVSSELDRYRTRAFFQFLAQVEGQVFLTTTRPELIETETSERADFHVRNGAVTA
jgi:DNA replication and repair protein RecF